MKNHATNIIDTIGDEKLKLQIICANCSLSKFCLPPGLDEVEVNKLDAIVSKREVIKKGNYLFTSGTISSNIYIIRSGAFKSTIYRANGVEQVIGFYFPGELLGFHGIATNKYVDSVIALKTSSVCVIRFNDLFNLSSQIPALQLHLFTIMSQKLNYEYMFNPTQSALEKIATFIISLSIKLQRCGSSDKELYLSMTRNDIANYLGLATETISRLFTELKKQNYIAINNRHIKILDLTNLKKIAGIHNKTLI